MTTYVLKQRETWVQRYSISRRGYAMVQSLPSRRVLVSLLLGLAFPTLSVPKTQGASLVHSKPSHLGVCPNQLNSNLWVDAQSTCERECNVDQDCAGFEKCCTNVCGLRSCVAARFSDGSPAQPDSQGGGGGAGAGGGVQEEPLPPALYNNPRHQSVYLGGTVSFHCDVVGNPKPDITWEKQTDHRESLIMRPDQMYGNLVITNIGQLVVYNAQPGDTGIYTCTARNTAGILRADFPLSVIRRTQEETSEEGLESDVNTGIDRPFFPGDCLEEINKRDCGEKHVDWYYDSKQTACLTFTHRGCQGSRNRFETYEECWVACQREGMGICSLPAVQGPCKAWEARWAYNSLIKQCQAFAYGGCQGNGNSFHSREECEDSCPQRKGRPCKACKPKGKMVPSLCRSDFAIVGRLTELIEDQDSGIARFSLEEVLRDEKMGLAFFNTRHLEVTLAKVDWRCPCPNVTVEEGPLLVMGEVQDGMAVLQPDSYVRPASDRRLKKIHEVLDKKTCELLQRFQD
ncbi:UNVERIFIED_CONTAM: hypothetical protein FKN15_000100 [Acipenser sinensis]